MNFDLQIQVCGKGYIALSENKFENFEGSSVNS